MRILIYGLNYAPEPVGIGKYTGELGPWLAARGHSVRVITAPPYFPGWRVSVSHRNCYNLNQCEDVRVRRCPLWVPRRPSGLTRLLHLASFALSSLGPLLAQCRWRPDVVITVAPAFFCAPAALWLGRLSGRRMLTWLHIQDFELDAAFELGLLKGRLLRSLAQAWERRTLRGFDRVSSISSAMVKRLEIKGVAPDRCVLLPNWVDLDVIRPQQGAARSDNVYLREFGIGPDQLVLMYSGSINKKQGLDLLAQVIHQLADLPQLVWLLAGEGPTKAELVTATQGLSNVRHLPLQPMECLNDWLNAADIHLLPQKAEAADLVLPSKLLGILASGTPVVASSPVGSELAGLAEQAGACVPPGDPTAFAAALRQLINSPQRRAEAGRQARVLAEERFGMNAVLGRFEQQLMAVVAEAKRSPDRL
ncbi:WcaI family glycosyltransferase [bacterium]|nr:WcaI family glycosyltransferase [bacterium]